MINTQKFLKSENSGSFFERANRKLISVNSMLRGSLTQRKARQRIKKKQEERRKREEEETRLEDTKSQKNPNNILKSLPRGPRDFISSFKEAIGKILFAFFSIKLLKALPLLKNILPMVFGAVDFVSGLGVGLINGLATFIDFGYKAYDSTNDFLKKVGGDGFAAGFEKFMGAVSTLIDILLLATVVRGMGDFGPGKPKKPKARRLRFLDFRKKGSGVAPPAKPKSKPVKPVVKGGIPKSAPKPVPKRVLKPVPNLARLPVVKPVKKLVPKTAKVKIPAPSKLLTKPKVAARVLVGSSVGPDKPGKPGAPDGTRTKLSVEERARRANELLKRQRVKRAVSEVFDPTKPTNAFIKSNRQLMDDLFSESFNPTTTPKRLKEISKQLDQLIIDTRAEQKVLEQILDAEKLPFDKQAALSVEAQRGIADVDPTRGSSGRTGPQILDDLVGPEMRKQILESQQIPKTPKIPRKLTVKPPSLFSQLRKISPASAARGTATFGASVAIELALQSLIDIGMEGIFQNKNRLKNRIENILKKSPKDQKEIISKIIKNVENELKYQKGPLALFDKIVATGGDTASDIKLRTNLAILYGLAAAGVEFEDFDISNFLLQEKRFTDVTGLKPIQIDKRETEQLSASQKRRMFRRSTGTRKTDEPQGAALSGDLKAEIRSAESGNDYGATFRKYLGGFSRANEDITKMSINQVVQYQRDYLNHQRKLGIPITQRSAAVGAYQMLEPDTAAKALGVPLSRKFDQKTQDLLANYYLNAAGRKEFETGKISAEEYNNRLAGQFASLRTTSGRGRYDDDGLNKAYKDILPLLKNKQNDRSQSLKTSASYDDQASNVIVVNKKQVLANMNNSGGGDGNVIVSTSSGSDRSRSRLYMLA